MADTSRQAIAAVVERLRAQAAALEADLIGVDGIQLVESDAMREAASLISALEAERDLLTKSGIVEVSIRNPNVADYMRHWEARAEAAEALNATLQAKLEKAAEALKPFSKAETDITSQLMLGNLAYSIVWPDDMPIGLLWDADDTDKALVSVTWGDFRRARSTLSTLRETTDDQT